MHRHTQTYLPCYRQIALDSFKKFFTKELLDELRRFDSPKRRCRKLGLEGWLWLGLCVAALGSAESLEAIFLQVAQWVAQKGTWPLALVSVSAFTQFRQRFPLEVLLRLWAALVHQAKETLGEPYRLWRGLRLWAVDGTGLTLPEDLWPFFRSHGGGRGDGPALSHLLVLYDLHARVPVKLRLAPCQTKEQVLAGKLLCDLGPGDLVLIDGGFYSIGLFVQLIRREINFVIPMRSNGSPGLLEMLGPDDGRYEIRASKQYWKDTPGVPPSLEVRIITVHRDGFRPRRLVTDLTDPEAFPAEELAHVYHQRWHIETFYRELKHTLTVEHWHARTPRSLYCEVLFMMILATMTRLVMAQAVSGSSAPGELSFSRSLRYLRTALAISALCPMELWPGLYVRLLQQVRRCRIDKRPGRQFERNRQKRRAQSRAKRLALMAEAKP